MTLSWLQLPAGQPFVTVSPELAGYAVENSRRKVQNVVVDISASFLGNSLWRLLGRLHFLAHDVDVNVDNPLDKPLLQHYASMVFENPVDLSVISKSPAPYFPLSVC